MGELNLELRGFLKNWLSTRSDFQGSEGNGISLELSRTYDKLRIGRMCDKLRGICEYRELRHFV